MHLEIKFKSITYRWFFNIFLITALVLCVAAIAFSVLFSALYIGKMESLANDYAYEFSVLSNSNDKTFKDNAIAIAGEFKYKDKIEVQVIDKNGNVFVSTTGVPITVSSGNSIIPLWSSFIPSSLPEHIMPSDNTPRNLPD